MVTLYRHSSWLQIEHGGRHKVFAGVGTDLDKDEGCKKILHLATGLCYAIQSGVLSVGWENISETKSRNILPSNFSDYNPYDYNVWSAVKQETNKILCNTKDELKARISTAFTNLNKTVQKSFRKFRNRLETVIEANGDFFEFVKFIVFQYLYWKNQFLFSSQIIPAQSAGAIECTDCISANQLFAHSSNVKHLHLTHR